jgi:hypothetical protein
LKIYDKRKKLLAIIIDPSGDESSKNFYTEDSLDIQVASFKLKKDDNIDRHYHLAQNRSISTTSEVIYVISGILEVSIYDDEMDLVKTTEIDNGKIIVLLSGGHEIKIIEDSNFIEVKQGPYDEENDKKRF